MATHASSSFDIRPTRGDLESHFVQKHGQPSSVGWAPRRRFQHGYSLPGDVYEALVSKLIFPGCNWVDVGGGHSIFPENPRLASDLVSRCARMVAIDPSPNVQQNLFATERVQCLLQDYPASQEFDVATIRMVVEHVEDPQSFVDQLARLVRPGGHVVVLTVNAHSPLTWLSWMLPFWLHHPIKRLFWSGEEHDTFPVHYRMNERKQLRRLFEKAEFQEHLFTKLDDLSIFSQIRSLNYLELKFWRLLSSLRITYPENCLLGVYQRQ